MDACLYFYRVQPVRDAAAAEGRGLLHNLQLWDSVSPIAAAWRQLPWLPMMGDGKLADVHLVHRGTWAQLPWRPGAGRRVDADRISRRGRFPP